jgi:hypothetical protein
MAIAARIPTVLAQQVPESHPAALLESIFKNKQWDILTRPHELTDALLHLGVVWAMIFVVLGTICVFAGYRWHKAVILVLALLAGGAIGRLLGQAIGVTTLVTGISGAALFGVLAWPILRYTVALFAGLAGAFCGANVWSSVGQPPDQHYIGAMIGLLVLGMLAFIAFRFVIIAFTAIGGASLLVIGALSMLLRLESWRSGIESSLSEHPLAIPIIAGSACAVGIIFQQGGGLRGMLESANSVDATTGKKKAAAA